MVITLKEVFMKNYKISKTFVIAMSSAIAVLAVSFAVIMIVCAVVV